MLIKTNAYFLSFTVQNHQLGLYSNNKTPKSLTSNKSITASSIYTSRAADSQSPTKTTTHPAPLVVCHTQTLHRDIRLQLQRPAMPPQSSRQLVWPPSKASVADTPATRRLLIRSGDQLRVGRPVLELPVGKVGSCIAVTFQITSHFSDSQPCKSRNR